MLHQGSRIGALFVLLVLASCADANQGRAGCAVHVIAVGAYEFTLTCPPKAMQVPESDRPEPQP